MFSFCSEQLPCAVLYSLAILCCYVGISQSLYRGSAAMRLGVVSKTFIISVPSLLCCSVNLYSRLRSLTPSWVHCGQNDLHCEEDEECYPIWLSEYLQLGFAAGHYPCERAECLLRPGITLVSYALWICGILICIVAQFQFYCLHHIHMKNGLIYITYACITTAFQPELLSFFFLT